MADDTLKVVAPSGLRTEIPASDFAEKQARGWRTQTAEEMAKSAREEKYGGLGGGLAAAGLGLARGATFGLSDLAMTHIRDANGEPLVNPETLKGYKEVNPGSTLAGEIGAVLLPSLPGAALGKVGKFLGKGVSGVEHGAELATEGLEHLGAKLVGHGAHGLGADLATHVIPKIVGAGVEGSAYGIGNEISEASLGNEELTAEKLLAGAGKGFAISGGVMAGGLLAKAAVKKLMPSNVKESILSAIQEKAQTLGQEFSPDLNRQKFLGYASRELDPVKGAKYKSAANNLGEKGLFSRGEVEFNPATNALEKVEGSGNSLPSRQGVLDRLSKNTEALSQHIDNVIGATDEAIAKGAVDADKIAAIKNRFATAPAKPGEFVEAAKVIDATGQAVEDGAIKKNMLSQIEKLRKSGMSDETAQKFVGHVDNILEKAQGASISDLQSMKRYLQGKVNYEGVIKSDAMASIDKTLARHVKEAIEDATDLARKTKALPMETAPIADLNRTLGDMIQVQKPLARAVGRADAYATAGGLRIRDLGLGAMTSMIGGTAAGIPGAIAGLGASIVNRAMGSEKGMLLRAELADNFTQAHLRSIAKKTGRFDQDLTQALDHFIAGASERISEVGTKVGARAGDKTAERVIEKRGEEGGEKALSRVVRDAPVLAHSLAHPFTPGGQVVDTDDKQKLFAVRSKELSDLVANPDRALDEVTKHNDEWRESAPKVNDAVVQKNIKALGFLYDKMPKNPMAGQTLMPQAQTWKPSDAELNKWARYVDAVRNPLGTIESLKHGTVTTEQVDALKAVYPKIYEQVQTHLASRLAEKKEALPYPTRLQLGTLFAAPGDETMQSGFTAAMRSLAQPPPKPHAPSPHTSKTVTAGLTQSQRVEGGLSK